MKRKSVEELKEIAKDLRKKVVTMVYEAQSGHPGGSLSAADFVTACYFREMNVDPKNPKWEDRDRFVLSKGHVCPIQYAALGTLGFFPEEVLHTLRQEGSPLQGHPNMHCPGGFARSRFRVRSRHGYRAQNRQPSVARLRCSR